MRSLIWTIASVFLTGCAFASYTTNMLKQSVVVHIYSHRMRNGVEALGMGTCSGTYIGPNTVLTAAHCLQGAIPGKLWVKGIDGVGRAAQIKVTKPNFDLGLLFIKGKPHEYAVFGKPPEVGDTVFNVGSPLDLNFLLSQGIVSAVDLYFAWEFKAHYIATTAMINPGSSGGGAFNGGGELIGVNTMLPGPGIALAVDVATIKEFLKGAK